MAIAMNHAAIVLAVCLIINVASDLSPNITLEDCAICKGARVGCRCEGTTYDYTIVCNRNEHEFFPLSFCTAKSIKLIWDRPEQPESETEFPDLPGLRDLHLIGLPNVALDMISLEHLDKLHIENPATKTLPTLLYPEKFNELLITTNAELQIPDEAFRHLQSISKLSLEGSGIKQFPLVALEKRTPPKNSPKLLCSVRATSITAIQGTQKYYIDADVPVQNPWTWVWNIFNLPFAPPNQKNSGPNGPEKTLSFKEKEISSSGEGIPISYGPDEYELSNDRRVDIGSEYNVATSLDPDGGSELHQLEMESIQRDAGCVQLPSTNSINKPFHQQQQQQQQQQHSLLTSGQTKIECVREDLDALVADECVQSQEIIQAGSLFETAKELQKQNELDGLQEERILKSNAGHLLDSNKLLYESELYTDQDDVQNDRQCCQRDFRDSLRSYNSKDMTSIGSQAEIENDVQQTPTDANDQAFGQTKKPNSIGLPVTNGQSLADNVADCDLVHSHCCSGSRSDADCNVKTEPASLADLEMVSVSLQQASEQPEYEITSAMEEKHNHATFQISSTTPASKTIGNVSLIIMIIFGISGIALAFVFLCIRHRPKKSLTVPSSIEEDWARSQADPGNTD